MAATEGVEQLIRFPDGSKVISWLPSAHIAERMAHHYLPIVYAMTITCCPNPREVVGYLPAVKPTWFFAVPRIWEKLKAGMEGFLASGEGGEQKRALAGRRDAQGRARAGRRAGARGPRGDRRGGRRAAVRAASARCSASTRSPPSTSAPRRRRARCSSSSTRSASRWPSCGACRRPAARAPATRPRRSRSAPSGRPRRASRSSSPRTASCWSAPTW